MSTDTPRQMSDAGSAGAPAADKIPPTAGDGAADCTLIMTAENGVALFEGRVSGEQLFFGNQLRVEGDMSLALRLQALLSIVR